MIDIPLHHNMMKAARSLCDIAGQFPRTLFAARGRTFVGSGGIDERKASNKGGSAGFISKTTTGWSPTCSCPSHDPIPSTVLDPFFGAGTTGLVADRLGRDCIGIELNPTYSAITERRIVKDAGMFAEIAS